MLGNIKNTHTLTRSRRMCEFEGLRSVPDISRIFLDPGNFIKNFVENEQDAGGKLAHTLHTDGYYAHRWILFFISP